MIPRQWVAMANVWDWFVEWGWTATGDQHVGDVKATVFWLAIGVALLLAVIHLGRRYYGRPPVRESISGASVRTDSGGSIVRYDSLQRLLYWSGALVMVIWLWSETALRYPAPTGLLGEAPITSWTGWHTASTFALAGLIAIYAIVLYNRGELWSVWPTRENLRLVGSSIKQFFGADEGYPRFGKYSPTQLSLYWVGGALIGFAMLTGIVRARRISISPLWEASRYPFGLGQEVTGLIFALRGVAFALLLGVIILHVYFALRKWEISKSIITGTISLETYNRYFDPQRWRPEGVEVIAEDGGQPPRKAADSREVPDQDSRNEG